MKRLLKLLGKYYPWLLLLLGVNCFCAIVLWISDIRAYGALIGLMVMAGILLFVFILIVLNKRERTVEELFTAFLSNPSQANEKSLLNSVSRMEGERIKLLAETLHRYTAECTELSGAMSDYEEYVEGWAHEAKTPLALLTMVLDNHGDELSPTVRAKLDYVRNRIQEEISQILYYARLKGTTKDYRFEEVKLRDCVEEVLEDYRSLLEEKQFTVVNRLNPETVFTDSRGLQFIIGQAVSNAIKYSSGEPMLIISADVSDDKTVLCIEDNGAGIKTYDLPYIFQKGFTGDSTDSRKKATGMGLYLAKEMADDLKIQLDAESKWGEGFKLMITFSKAF